jgi:hypothetical protein
MEIVRESRSDNWLLRDSYGDLYRLRQTMEPGNPIVIECVQKWNYHDGPPSEAEPLTADAAPD